MPKHIVFNVPCIYIGVKGSDMPTPPAPPVVQGEVGARMFDTGAAIVLGASVLGAAAFPETVNAGDTVSGTVAVDVSE